MAELYWVTFRIEQQDNYNARYKALDEAVSEASKGKWWKEPTSFYLFESDLEIGPLATHLKAAIDSDIDLALIGMPHKKAARIIGQVRDDDLFELLDFVKTA